MSKLSDAALTRLRDHLVRPVLPERYALLDIIGRGGMGVVWRAHDHLLERDVAIKVLAEHIDGTAFTQRLQREARILARLEHPGIVAVHDTGTLDDGRAWYVMRLIRGEQLDHAAASFATVGDALRVMMRLVETVAFAHAKGVLHRDLTPRNVMLGPFGEVLVLDWGVAREGSTPDLPGTASTGPADPVTTAHGTILGTPGYMAPEQAAGLPADERSDVYGLGAILRDLLAVRQERIPKPLAAIRDRALAPDPGRRYPDATSLGEDLRRFQDGAPVKAYREGPIDILSRLTRTYRTPVLLVTAYLVMRLLFLWWKGR